MLKARNCLGCAVPTAPPKRFGVANFYIVLGLKSLPISELGAPLWSKSVECGRKDFVQQDVKFGLALRSPKFRGQNR